MRRILFALAAALACAACTEPFFDPTATSAAATIGASRLVGSTWPFEVPDLDYNEEPDFRFGSDVITYLPLRSAGTLVIDAGFVTRRYQYDNWSQVYFQWFDGNDISWLQTPGGFKADEGGAWTVPYPINDGGWLGFIHFGPTETETWLDHLKVDMGSPSCYWDPPPGPPDTHWQDIGMGVMGPLGLGSTPVVVGFSVNPGASSTMDQAYALVRVDTVFYEAKANFDDTGFTGISSAITPGGYDFTFLDKPRYMNYFRDEANGRSFAQWHEWDGWHAGAWRGTADGLGYLDIDDVVILGHRIDAVLSPDAGPAPATYLLSTEDQVGRVYRYAGPGTEALVAEFPLGTLRFIGEMDLAGEWQLLFSRTVPSGNLMSFEIRGIATADLITSFGL